MPEVDRVGRCVDKSRAGFYRAPYTCIRHSGTSHILRHTSHQGVYKRKVYKNHKITAIFNSNPFASIYVHSWYKNAFYSNWKVLLIVSYPIWIYHSEKYDFYGLPIHGNSGSKIGIDAGGPVVTADSRNFNPDPVREQACIDHLKKTIPRVNIAVI